MQSNCKNKVLPWIVKQCKNGNISLVHKLQRKEGQWNNKVRSDLIDSFLRDYPVNPAYGIREDKVLSIIDGVQRISTIRDYMEDKFSLSKNLDPIVITKIQGDERVETVVEIAGKKFSKLDDEVKDILSACELPIYELTDVTEKDVREIFRRQNAGKALSKTQLRKVVETDEMGAVINDLSSHKLFMKLLSPAQRRKDADKDYVRETLMLIETTPENDYVSFRDVHINAFIEEYQKNIPYDKIDILKQAMTKLDENFDLLDINASSIPMVLYVAYRTVKDKKSFQKLVDIIARFIDTYNENEEYKALCGQGTTSSDKVRGRFEYWRSLYKEIG